MWRVLSLLLVACSAPEYGSGHLHCATTGRACPDDFYCGAGGLCWKNGTGPEMGAPEDLAGVDLAGADLTTLPDLSVVADLAGADFAGADLSALPDLTVPIDLAGADASSPSLCPGTFKICDGFETATLDARWTTDLNGGTVTVDNSRAYRGASSLHVHTNAAAAAGANPFANLVTYMTLPYTGTAYVRAWFYLPSSYPTSFNQLLNFADASGGGTSFSTSNGHAVLNDYATPPSFQESGTVTLPTNQWVCLALSIAQSGTTGPVKLFVNGSEVTDTSFASATTPSMTHIYLGLDWSGSPASFPATDVWMDEVIVNDSPVTCAQ